MDGKMTTGEYMASLLTPELVKALEGVRAWAETSDHVNAEAALIYVDHVPQAMIEAESVGIKAENGLSMQLNYVLANLQYWLWAEAKHVKSVLKAHTNQG